MLALAAALLLAAAPDAGAPQEPSDAELLALLSAPSRELEHSEPTWAALGLLDPLTLRDFAGQGVPAVLRHAEEGYRLSPAAARHVVAARFLGQALLHNRHPQPAEIDRVADLLGLAAREAPGQVVVPLTYISTVLLLWGGKDVERRGQLLAIIEAAPDPAEFALQLAKAGHVLYEWQYTLLSFAVVRKPALLARAMALDDGSTSLDATAFRLLALDGLVATPELATRVLHGLLAGHLPAMAAQVWAGLPASVRRDVIEGRMLQLKAPTSDGTHGSANLPDLRLDLAGALLAAGDKAGAQVLEAKATDASPLEKWLRGNCSSRLHRQVLAYHLRSERPDDPFDLLLELRSCANGQEPGWRELLAPLLAKDYPRTARNNLAPALAKAHDPIADEVLLTPRLESALGLVAQRMRAALAEQERRREATLATLSPEAPHEAQTDGGVGASGVAARALAAEPTWLFREHKLAELKPSPGSKRQVLAPDAISAPEGYSVVRAERYGKRVVALALSQRYDPSGEVSGGGYWLLQSFNRGATFTQETYLNLRQYLPYEFVAESDLPLLEDESLRVEVEVRELDQDTIRFPPLRLGTKRTEKGLYLEARLSDLERDSDGDGLTDLAEERLLLDPHRADSDGDGIPDGSDLLPAIPSGGGGDHSLLEAVLAELSGEQLEALVVGLPGPSDGGLNLRLPKPQPTDRHPVLFISGDSRLFRGVRTTRRLIVLSPDEVKQARKRFGPFYPIELEVESNKAGTKAFIEFNEGWRGGSYKAVKKDGHWVLTNLGMWVT